MKISARNVSTATAAALSSCVHGTNRPNSKIADVSVDVGQAIGGCDPKCQRTNIGSVGPVMFAVINARADLKIHAFLREGAVANGQAHVEVVGSGSQPISETGGLDLSRPASAFRNKVTLNIFSDASHATLIKTLNITFKNA